jgi:hypothetical protein
MAPNDLSCSGLGVEEDKIALLIDVVGIGMVN